MVYKSLNNQAPIYLTEMFVRLSDACKRELRNTKTDLAVPRRKLAFGQKCFLCLKNENIMEGLFLQPEGHLYTYLYRVEGIRNVVTIGIVYVHNRNNQRRIWDIYGDC